MSRPTISCIVPTCGRITLARLFGTLLHQLSPDDRVIVVGDGHQPWSQRFCEGMRKVRYLDGPETHCWGNAQRQVALPLVTTDAVIFADDDDRFFEHALDTMRDGLEETPGRPLLGQMIDKHGLVLWMDQAIRQGNVSTQMVCFPRVLAQAGVWGNRYEGDLDYIQSVVAGTGEAAVVWRPNIWQTCRG